MILSALHTADVVPRGRRKEIRRHYRLDLPVELARVGRRDLVDAVEIEFGASSRFEGRKVVFQRHGDALWRPFVPENRRERATVNELPGERAEANAMTEAELDHWRGGEMARRYHYGYGHDDPIERPRGLTEGKGRHANWRPANAFPRIEDEPGKVLWSDRPTVEERLRRAAAAVMLVDGKVWTRAEEPVLELDLERGERKVVVEPEPAPLRRARWNAFKQFRMDRLDQMLDWAVRQGANVVRSRKELAEAAVGVSGAVRALAGYAPRRDDARFALAGRIGGGLHESSPLVRHLPSAAVDAYAALKRFAAHPEECAAPTAALYEQTEALCEALEGLSGLSEAEFLHRGRGRAHLRSLMARWQTHERALHAETPAATPAP